MPRHLITLLVFYITLQAPVLALEPIQTTEILGYNDLVVKEEHHRVSIEIVGLDPFLILQPKNNITLGGHSPRESQTESSYIIIDLSLQTKGSQLSASQNAIEPTPLNIEIFFNPQRITLAEPGKALQQSYAFDALHKIIFRPEVETNSSRVFALAIEETTKLKRDMPIRLDIDGCKQCTVQLNSAIRFVSKDQLTKLIEHRGEQFSHIGVDEQLIYSGIEAIPGSEISIEPSRWLSNDLKKSGSNASYSQSGDDPYFASPNLAIATDSLGGVYFELESNQAIGSVIDFQLFWATENHRFIEPASSVFRTKLRSQTIKLFLPLSFLNQQPNQAKLLHQLRLDIAQHGRLSAKASSSEVKLWRLLDSKLVAKAHTGTFKQFIPTSIATQKLQKGGKRRLLNDAIYKLGKDPVFLFFFLFLICVGAYLLASTTRRR